MKSLRIRFDPEKLKDPKTAAVFQKGGKFDALCVLDSDVDTLVNRLKEGLTQQLEGSRHTRIHVGRGFGGKKIQ